MAKKIPDPHDRLFKQMLQHPTAAADIARIVLPAEILAELDLSRIEAVDGASIDPELAEHFSDALFKVPLVGTGHEGYLLLLDEHKSAPDRWVALQTLRYSVQCWTHLARNAAVNHLPVIIPLVLYHGKRKWRIPRGLGALFGTVPSALRPFVPRWNYELLNLCETPPEQIHADPVVRVFLLVLQAVFRQNFRQSMPEILKTLPIPDGGAIECIQTLIRYLSTQKIERQEMVEMIKTAFPESEGFGLEDIVEDLAKEYIDQAAENGRQKGRREGRQEGRQEGRFSILFLQLCYKLGTAKLPANLKSQMAALSPEQLDQLGEDLFDFSTIADLRRWLAELP